MSLSKGQNSFSVGCKICAAKAPFFGESIVLKKYQVKYYRCEKCGFIQAQEPYWLDEAYSSAIAAQDVGIMQRNLVNRDITAAVLKLLFPKVANGVDIGGGHGVFVRLMRDRGFEFFWSDRYATNDYAKGFECQQGLVYQFLTAFEVLEHMIDPIAELSEVMSISDNVLVSTCLVPEPAPSISDWWYYAPQTGQHISFYTLQSLHLLASRFGRHVLSVGPYHLFSKEQKNGFLYRLVTTPRIAKMVNLLLRRKSLIESDLKTLTRQS
jgi:Methyltransferase domain